MCHYKLSFPLISDNDIAAWDEDLPEGAISYDDRGIIPLSFSSLCAFVNTCLSDGRMTISGDGLINPSQRFEMLDIYSQKIQYDAGDPSSDGTTGIFVDIALDLMSDEEMIASFKILLKRWREQTGIPEMVLNERKRFGVVTQI